MNRRIPVTSIEPLFYDDVSNGVRYLIRPKSGRTNLKFSSIIGDLRNGAIDSTEAICFIVDTYTYKRVAINGTDVVKDFPAGVAPTDTDLMPSQTIIDIYDFILAMNGLSNKEKKSSSQQQTLSSEQMNTGNSTTATTVNTGTKKGTAAKSKRKNT